MSMKFDQDDQHISLLALDQYMRWVKWTPELTLEEEGQLLERVDRGKQEQLKLCPDRQVLEEARQARDRLVAGFQPLVIHIASTYRYRVRSMDVMDLIQEGNLGLLQAIDVNDTNKGYSLAGLAGRCIRDAILQAVYYRDRQVRFSMRTEQALAHLSYMQSQLASLLGRDPSLEELAEALSLDQEKVEELLALGEQGQVESLHLLLDEDEQEERSDFVTLFGASVVAEDARQVHLAQAVHQAAEAALSTNEREVLRLRYGFDGECHLQREAAVVLGMMPNSIQRIERRAKARLREQLAPVYAAALEELSA